MSVGRDISAMPQQSQAAAVAKWIRKTARPTPYTLHVSAQDAVTEVERRAGATEAERFQELFVVEWRKAHTVLNQLWPHEVHDVVAQTASLAIKLNVGDTSDGLTPYLVSALCDHIKPYLAFAVSPSNHGRSTELVKAINDKSKDDGITAEARQQLQENAQYQRLVDDVKAHSVDEHVAITKLCMHAKHAAGTLFLMGKLNERFWKERAGARTDASINAVFDESLAFEQDGTAQDWTNLVQAGKTKAFIGGKFAGMNFWDTLKAVVAKREGSYVVEAIDIDLTDKSANALWSDPERLRLLEWPMQVCMSLAGFGGSDSFSFKSWYRDNMRLATSIQNMPATCLPAKGLKARLQECAAQQMQCVTDRSEAMLAMQPATVRRVSSFVVDGQALGATTALSKHVARIRQELVDGLHGCAKDAQNNWYADDESRRGNNKKREREEWSDWDPKADKKARQATWGSAAPYGIATSTDGKRILFGNQVCTFNSPPDCKANCVARFASGKYVDKWCPTPLTCWQQGGEEAHARLDEFPDEACKSTNLQSTPGVTKDDFTNVIVAPSAGGDAAGKGGGRGKGDKGGGRGKGGKGKGGRGKGGKGGKGKGAKGKGGRNHFGRR